MDTNPPRSFHRSNESEREPVALREAREAVRRAQRMAAIMARLPTFRTSLDHVAEFTAECYEMGFFGERARARLKDAIETCESGGQDAEYKED